MKPLTEYARATPTRQAEMLREWAQIAASHGIDGPALARRIYEGWRGR